MLKNFRIRTKLILGFALVLVVFTVSVAVTWSLMNVVLSGNDFIVNKALPAQAMARQLNDGSYELLITTRALQFSETDQAVADVKTWMANVQKNMDDITAFAAKTPDARAAVYAVENAVPRLKRYFESLENSFAGIAKKNEAYAAIMNYANTMRQGAESLRSGLMEHSVNRTREGVSDVNALVRRLSVVDQAAGLAIMAGDVRLSFLRAVSQNNLSDMEANMASLDAIEAAADSLKNETTVPANQQMVDSLKSSVAGYRTSLQDYMVAYRALDKFTQERLILREEINKETTEAINIASNRINQLSTISLADLNTSITLLAASAIISIVLGLLIAFLISRSIAKPLSTIVGIAKRTGNGDLTITGDDFAYNGRDEMGELVEAMTKMITSQEGVMQQVIAVAGELGGSAGSLSAISEETNASMEEVKASIEQVSALSEANGAALEESNAGVEEMSAGADTVARSATDSAAFISQTTEASNRAIQTVSNVIRGMHDVDKNSKESETQIRNLVTSVDNVSSFVTVITGIADQTNLLALNAAIEAARAGEVGRGFAVVAEEVRKLAEESARAAQSVNGIIVDLQSGAQKSIEVTTEAGRRLGDTLINAEQAQAELNNALKEMNKANDSIQNIAAVAEEQAASSKEVATAIDGATKSTMEMVNTISGIRRATEETAKAAQGVAEHSESMSRHAKNLSDVLSHFKLRQNSDSDSGKIKALKAK